MPRPLPHMDAGQSPTPVLLQVAPLAVAPQQRLRRPQFSEGPSAQSMLTCCPPSKAGTGHLFHLLFPPISLQGRGKEKKERGTETTTDQYVAFPVSSTGKTHAVGKSMMSRLVSTHKQPDPPAGGCCVFPQGTM